MDRPRDPLHHIDKTLAPGGALMRRGVPEAVERAAARMAQLVIGQALPVTETLLGEIGQRWRVGARDLGRTRQAGAHDRPRRLVRAAQMVGDPGRIARQLPRESGEYGSVGTVARHIRLPVDAAAMFDGGVPYPPEPRCRSILAGTAGPDCSGVERRDFSGMRRAGGGCTRGSGGQALAHPAAATSSIMISPIC